MDVAWTAASNGEGGIGTVFVGAGVLGVARSGWVTLEVARDAASNGEGGIGTVFVGAGVLGFALSG